MSNIFTNICSATLLYRGSTSTDDRVLTGITLVYNRTLLDKLFIRPRKVTRFFFVDKAWRTGINYRKVTDDEFALIQRCIEHGITALNV